MYAAIIQYMSSKELNNSTAIMRQIIYDTYFEAVAGAAESLLPPPPMLMVPAKCDTRVSSTSPSPACFCKCSAILSCGQTTDKEQQSKEIN